VAKEFAKRLQNKIKDSILKYYIVKQKKDSECAKNLKDSKANTKSKDTPVEENSMDGSKDTPIEATPFGGSELETALYKFFKRYGII
jgi:hypothetical protein